MGGYFCSEAKYAGWDGIIVQGKAAGPCYIAIRDDKVEIVDAPKLWGCGHLPRHRRDHRGHGHARCQVAAIGQAGQNLVAQAVVMNGSSHSAGAGMGAVLGSKNCVGIGVVGTGHRQDRRVQDGMEARSIDYAMTLVGSNNQAFLPNTPQPWSDVLGRSALVRQEGPVLGQRPTRPSRPARATRATASPTACAA